MVDQNNRSGEGRTILQVQQDFATNLGYAEEIIWDLLSPQQCEILKSKIKQLIPGPLDNSFVTSIKRQKAIENMRETHFNTPIDDSKRQRAIENMREILFNSVWDQRKYTNGISLTSIIYVLVATDEVDTNRAENAKSWSCHPVFRARRCISNERGTTSDSSDCCMIFVDENGRVYQNWKSYITDNELPAGIMVAPELGAYRLTDNRVRLDKYLTPAGSVQSQALEFIDKTTAISGFAAACVPVAALISIPVAAPLMAAASVVGLASAAYTTLRSGGRLLDRSQHEQSINVTDRTARGHWMGFTAGAVGLGAAGATSAMTAATTAGREVGVTTQLIINGMNMSSILLSGSGVFNGILDLFLKYNDGDDISTMDVLQLSASLVLFTHSVYNFQLASTIISETQNNVTARYRETLSNRQRRIFDKMSKETIRIRGAATGKMDIIRGINDVPSKQQFNDLYKINKQLNEKGVRPAFGTDGKGIVLNDQVIVNTQELRASVQHNQGPDVLSQVTNPIPSSSNQGAVPQLIGSRLIGPTSNVIDTSESTQFSTGVRVLRLSNILINGMLICLKDFGLCLFENIVNAESFEMLIIEMADRFRIEVFTFIINLTESFMNLMRDDIQSELRFFISTESVLYRILKHILDNHSQNVDLEYISKHTFDILTAVKAYFLSLNPNIYSNLLKKCTVCSGYFICNN